MAKSFKDKLLEDLGYMHREAKREIEIHHPIKMKGYWLGKKEAIESIITRVEAL